MSYQFLDANASVLTADSSVIAGSGITGTQRPIINIGSILHSVPVTLSGNSSVSGTVGASVIGTVPITQGGPLVASVSGTAGASVIGTVPVTQGGTWTVSGSIVTQAQGSIVALNIGSIISTQVGSVITVFQAPSIVGTYSEDAAHTTADKGLFVLGVRNDAVASFAGANLEYSPQATDSAGRVVTKPFSPDESRAFGHTSVNGTSITALFTAAGTGLRNYITDIAVANTGSVATLVTFRDSDASVIGRTIAPATGGSNINGMAMPWRTGSLNSQVDFVSGTAASVLYVTATGYRAP